MCEEKPWEYPSLAWIHRAREQHVEEEKVRGPGLSPEAKALADRLNLPFDENPRRRR